MLQHDADLASGARRLTTASLPPLDPTLERILTAARNASEANRPLRREAVQTEAEANQEPAQIAWTVFQPATASPRMSSEESEHLGKTKEASPSLEAKLPVAKASAPSVSGYRVPETRSVQLLPPIVVVNSASPPPNVIIIDMFPSSR